MSPLAIAGFCLTVVTAGVSAFSGYMLLRMRVELSEMRAAIEQRADELYVRKPECDLRMRPIENPFVSPRRHPAAG